MYWYYGSGEPIEGDISGFTETAAEAIEALAEGIATSAFKIDYVSILRKGHLSRPDTDDSLLFAVSFFPEATRLSQEELENVEN